MSGFWDWVYSLFETKKGREKKEQRAKDREFDRTFWDLVRTNHEETLRVQDMALKELNEMWRYHERRNAYYRGDLRFQGRSSG